MMFMDPYNLPGGPSGPTVFDGFSKKKNEEMLVQEWRVPMRRKSFFMNDRGMMLVFGGLK